MYIYIVIEHVQDDPSIVNRAFRKIKNAVEYINEQVQLDIEHFKTIDNINPAWLQSDWVASHFYSISTVEI